MVADEQGAGHGGGGDDEVLEDEGEGEEDDYDGAKERGETLEGVFVRRPGGRCAHRAPPVMREVYRGSACCALRVREDRQRQTTVDCYGMTAEEAKALG